MGLISTIAFGCTVLLFYMAGEAKKKGKPVDIRRRLNAGVFGMGAGTILLTAYVIAGGGIMGFGDAEQIVGTANWLLQWPKIGFMVLFMFRTYKNLKDIAKED